MELITLKTFDNSVEAHILRSRLESEGIPCFLFDENMISLNPLYNVTLGGIKLKIHNNDLERANKIIAEIENTPFTAENNEILKCPNCGKTDLYGGFKSMKGMSGVFSFIFSVLFMVFPLHYKTSYRCKSCGFEFRR